MIAPLSNQAEEMASPTSGGIAESGRSAVPVQSSPEEANLDKVRELLFGHQVRSSAQQFKALETELIALRTDFEGRLERLEGIVTRGFDSITQQIEAEREDRKAAIATTAQSITEMGDEVHHKQAQLDQKLGSEAQALQQQILDASHQFKASLQQKSEDFLRDLNQESKRRQQQERAHKSRLSALLSELSERLNEA